MSDLGVSIVIPTLNRDGFLYDSISDMIQQDYPKFEIIVVDQSDEVNREVEQLIKKNTTIVKYYRDVGFKGLPQARNFGWQNAKYEIILYIDDDIRADKDFITNHVKGFNDESIGVVGGRVDEQGMSSGPKVGLFNPWTFDLSTGFASKRTQLVDHVKGCNFSIRKKALAEVGGFEEKISIGAALYEELEAILRIRKKNYKVLFNADAELKHLVAVDGGCRIKDVAKYMWGLAHNRSIVITRNVKFYQKPTAYMRLLLLGLSYSRTAKSMKPFFATIEGIIAGRKAGLQPVVCGNYRVEEH